MIRHGHRRTGSTRHAEPVGRTGPRKKPLAVGIRLALSLMTAVLVAFTALAVPACGAFGQNQGQSLSPSSSATFDDASTALSDTPLSGNNTNTSSSTIRISLVGDVNLADGWGADVAHENGDSVAAAFSPDLLAHLRSSDIFYANHEFTMSNRGEPLNKYYTFRANPAYVDDWTQLGVDIVGLGNNHADDYGIDAFLDTLALLDANGIKYVGAGRNLAEAMTPVCFTINGYTIAFVAADRSQKGDEPRAQAAGEDTPGVLFCFDDTNFLTAVANARQEADFVIAIPHWGTEMSTELEPEQIDLAHKLIDAGADAVIGSHPHILQGMDFYNGKLIAYSLGNFWFNTEATPTMALDIEITDGVPQFRMIPALQSGGMVTTSAETNTEVIDLMRGLSPNTVIDDNGYITAR